MFTILELGISEESLKNMLEVNPDIVNLEVEEIEDKISILRNIQTDEKIIKNIIESNPLYLSRSNSDVIELINKLNSLGIKRVDITFDSNPWLLNYDSFEIDDFIREKQELGMYLDDIIDMIEAGMID